MTERLAPRVERLLAAGEPVVLVSVAEAPQSTAQDAG